MVDRKLILILILLASCASGLSQKGTRASIALEKDTWHFGTIRRGEEVTTSIALRNRGSDTLNVALFSTCDCLTGKVETETLLPRTQTAIFLSYIGDEVKERVTKTVFVDSNDRASPRLTITVTGRVLKGQGPHLVVIPTPLLFEQTDEPGSQAILSIANRGKENLFVEEVRCFGCKSDWSPVEVAEGQELGLRIELLSNWSGQRWIEIESNDPVVPLTKVAIVEL